jgi:hypothetical protein
MSLPFPISQQIKLALLVMIIPFYKLLRQQYNGDLTAKKNKKRF